MLGIAEPDDEPRQFTVPAPESPPKCKCGADAIRLDLGVHTLLICDACGKKERLDDGKPARLL